MPYNLIAKDEIELQRMAKILRSALYELRSENILVNQYAIHYSAIVLTECASALSPNFKEDFAYIPWYLLVRLRTFVLHRFHWLELEPLANNLLADFPILLHKIEQILGHSSDEKIEKLEHIEAILSEQDDRTEEFKQTQSHKLDQKHERKRKLEQLEEDAKEQEIQAILQEQTQKAIPWLNRILQEIDTIDQFLKDDPNFSQKSTFTALKMSLVIIGLCVKEHLSAEFKLAYPLAETIKIRGKIHSVDWEMLVYIRKRLVHYFSKCNDYQLKVEFVPVARKIRPFISELKSRCTVPVLMAQQAMPETDSKALSTIQQPGTSITTEQSSNTPALSTEKKRKRRRKRKKSEGKIETTKLGKVEEQTLSIPKESTSLLDLKQYEIPVVKEQSSNSPALPTNKKEKKGRDRRKEEKIETTTLSKAEKQALPVHAKSTSSLDIRQSSNRFVFSANRTQKPRLENEKLKEEKKHVKLGKKDK